VHHSYLDKYARGDSALHRLDERFKFLFTISLIFLIASFPDPGIVFILTLLFMVIILYLYAEIPLEYWLLRSAVVLPFSGFAAISLAFTTPTASAPIWSYGHFTLTAAGLHRAAALLLRSWLAVSLMILLINTTPFDRLLRVLSWMRVPALLILLLAFLYRYLYLFWDEAERMSRARDSRYFGGRLLSQADLLGRMVGMLFLRSYDRAERVSRAMAARGWSGEYKRIPATRLTGLDVVSFLIGAGILIALWMIRRL
jgi:cobalt/nickel transport system permease protein